MSARIHPARFARSLVVSALGALLWSGLYTAPALAAGASESGLDPSVLTDLEVRAAAAQPRERCYLYSELLHGWTELASRDMAAGNDAGAAADLQHADLSVQALKTALAADSKRLKNAELLLEHTARRLSDMVRVSSMDQHDAMQAVLKHLNNVHDALLAQIFAH